ncbi:MAG TPA: ABC transporter permease [Phycisphaerales bacterium]|nr:ABC transporter permease [Phycisphaerales bacterium]
MNRILHIAMREFASTALTKGFIIGGFIVPAVILVVMLAVMPMLMNDTGPAIVGDVAVIDKTGELSKDIQHRLSRETLQSKRQDHVPPNVPVGTAPDAQDAAAVISTVLDGSVPDLTVIPLDPDTDIEQAKKPLREGAADEGGLLALAVIDPDAVVSQTETGVPQFGGYQLFIKPKLKDSVQATIRSAIKASIREARLEHAGLSPEQVAALTTIKAGQTKEVTEEGERDSIDGLNMLLPGGFLILMMMAVFIGGQYLLTTTVEEKASRVVEVLLSAVSPMQLMTGKILGQLGVGLLIMAVYGSIGVAGLIFATLTDVLDPMTIVWMVAFFLIAYVQIASMMAAIGSAVNEMREAQSLMAPVMAVLMIPYMLWLPVAMNPSGTFATVCSFVPPVNSFMMIVRIASTEPPPTWQILTSLLIGLASTYAILWATAKIFRVGLLMYGKPPNFRTLVRWIRMA